MIMGSRAQILCYIPILKRLFEHQTKFRKATFLIKCKVTVEGS